MKIFVSGVSGFIGSNLTNMFLNYDHEIVGFDNFSTGKIEFLNDIQKNKNFKLIKGTISNQNEIAKAMQGCDFVFHLAAHADVRLNLKHPEMVIQNNLIGTFNVLEAMRINNIKKIAFTSTASIYGNTQEFPTPIDYRLCNQTSIYGATKLACESLIESYCEGYDFQSWIFRLASVLGRHYQHGHIIDFVRQLKEHPDYLNVLGNGNQQKSYIYMTDLLQGIMAAFDFYHAKVNTFNMTGIKTSKVKDSVRWICDYMELKPKVHYQEQEPGWVGDNKIILQNNIDPNLWFPKFSNDNAVKLTVDYILNNPWLLERIP